MLLLPRTCRPVRFWRASEFFPSLRSDPALPSLTLTSITSEKFRLRRTAPPRGESQPFPNVRSVHITPQCIMSHRRHFLYAILMLVESHLVTDLETLQASMKVVLCTGM